MDDVLREILCLKYLFLMCDVRRHCLESLRAGVTFAFIDN
jgi:hypothetical protein